MADQYNPEKHRSRLEYGVEEGDQILAFLRGKMAAASKAYQHLLDEGQRQEHADEVQKVYKEAGLENIEKDKAERR